MGRSKKGGGVFSAFVIPFVREPTGVLLPGLGYGKSFSEWVVPPSDGGRRATQQRVSCAVFCSEKRFSEESGGKKEAEGSVTERFVVFVFSVCFIWEAESKGFCFGFVSTGGKNQERARVPCAIRCQSAPLYRM